MNKHLYRVIGVLLVTVAPTTIAQPIDQAQARALMAECQATRRDAIRPLKAEAVDDCINQQQHDADYCERLNETFGEHSNVGAATGLFWDLPVCQEALAADRFFKMNPGAATFTPN